jgi:hypothetical protein
MSARREEEMEVDERAPERGTVAELYKLGGAFALVGLEFDYQARDEQQPSRIRLEGMMGNRETYKAVNMRTLKPLEDAVTPRELTVGLKSRGPRYPVIKLMRSVRMPAEPYLDPLAERPSSGRGEYRTPEDNLGIGREAPRLQAPVPFGGRGMHGGFQPRAFGERMASPVQRAPFSPRMQANYPAFP